MTTITTVKMRILRDLADNPGSTANEIAVRLGVDRGKISPHMSQLFRQGRVDRETIVGPTNTLSYRHYVVQGSQFEQDREPGRKSTHVNSPLTHVNPSPAPSLEAAFNSLAQSIAQHLCSLVQGHVVRGLADLASSVPAALAAPQQAPQPEPPPRLVPQARVVPPHELAEKPVPAALSTLPSVSEIKGRIEASVPTKPVVKKHRVLVVGLLPQQAGLISTEFGDGLALEFWNDANGDGVGRLRELAKHAETVFCHTAHCSHMTGEVIKSTGAELIIVRGGMTRMREMLLEFYSKIAPCSERVSK